MELDTLIKQKRAMLDVARAKIIELEHQIQVLSSMNKTDDFDAMLASKIKTPVQPTLPYTETVAVDSHSYTTESKDVSIEARTQGGRNPKGSVRRLLLEILSDDQERDLDYIEQQLNARAANPVSRAGLRTALMLIKNDGDVISRKSGLYQRAKKGENPGATGFSNAT